MNKKLICLTLSILMLLACVFTGCSGCSGNKDSEEDTENVQDNSAKTITMWLIGQNPPTVEELSEKVRNSIEPQQKTTLKVNEKTGAAVLDKNGQPVMEPMVDEKGNPIMETYEEAAERVCMAELKKAQDAVQVKFSAITKAKFKTNVILQFCTEEEYYEKLESCIKQNEEAIELKAAYDKALKDYKNAQKKTDEGKKKDNKTLTLDFHALPENDQYKHLNPYDPKNNIEIEDEDDAPESDVYTENVDGVQEIKYPEPKENQVDIFYIGDTYKYDANGEKTDKVVSGYDKYMSYYNNDWLASLNEELSTSSKKLESYISTSLLKGVEIDGVKYAIPNNVPIGKYTYMFIDKAYFDEYCHKIESISDVTDLGLFLNDIKFENTGKNADDADYVVPLAASFEECIKMLTWYWDVDYADPTVYETYFDEATGRTYVLQKEYTPGKDEDQSPEEGKEEGAGGGAAAKPQYIDKAIADSIYLMNEQGQFLDEDGNVLPYSYKIETAFSWYEDENGFIKKREATNSRALYLVDDEGNPVSKENDRRVIVTENVVTKEDENGNVLPTYRYFINEDADFSILGTLIPDPALRNRGSINLAFTSLFTNKEYRDLYATLKNYQYEGYYGEPNRENGQKAAVSFVKGDAKILMDYEASMEALNSGKDGTGFVYDAEKYRGTEGEYIKDGEKYYVVVAEYPEATETELYGNMYGVYANSPYLSRAMKVITYLNTNSEMRDLLQYGIEGNHYLRNEDGTAKLLKNDPDYGTYRMTVERTGNCFIATPPESRGADAWTYAKIQNNASKINPLLGFDFNTATEDSDYNLDVALLDYIKQLNAEAQVLIGECSNKEDLVVLMTDADNGFMNIYTAAGATNKDKMKKALNAAYDPASPGGENSEIELPADTSGSSPYTVYYEWLTEFKYLPDLRPID